MEEAIETDTLYYPYVIKYYAVPDTQTSQVQYTFEILYGNCTVIDWNNFERNPQHTMFTQLSEAKSTAIDMLELVFFNPENPEDNVEEYPEDFRLHEVK